MTEPFKPKPLPSVSVEAPMERRWDVMGAEESRRLHARAQADVRRFSWTGPRARRRMVRCFLLTPIGFAAIGWVFVAGNSKTLVAFLVAGLLLGVLTFVFHPLDFLSGAIYALCGLAAAALCGRTSILVLPSILLLCGSIGIVQGRMEELRRIDEED
jgi:hypothetical protein